MSPMQQGGLGPMGRKTALQKRILGAWWQQAPLVWAHAEDGAGPSLYVHSSVGQHV